MAIKNIAPIKTTVSEFTSVSVSLFEEKVFEEKVFEKKCTKCGELKNINDFYKDKTSPDGKLSYCKKCRDKQIEEYKLKKLKERGW